MRHTSGAGAAPLSIATMLTPKERLRIDAAGEGSYQALHRDSVAEVVQDLKNNRASAVVVSVARCDQYQRASVAALVREFPRVPTVALLTDIDRTTPHTMLSLGSTGLRQLVDVRESEGWRELRNYLLAARREDIQREALSQLSMDLAGVPLDCWRFFEALFLAAPTVTTVRELAEGLEVLPSTLMSRFFRAALPSPKQYVAYARLVWAAYLGESSGMSIAAIANRLNASSPQSFHRTVRTIMRMSAAEFRYFYTGARMLEMFRSRLVTPYRDTLRTFDPTADSGPTFPTGHTPSATIPFTARAEKGRAA